ncbi:MAG: hypothetical protein ACMXX7_02910 [Candidatus Woesearchaeota archaeon]
MPKISINFISEKLKNNIIKLKEGDDSERKLYFCINKAFQDIENYLVSCIKIPKKFWPKEYNKYNLSNLWKYDLPNGWRLIFSLKQDDVLIIAIVLEWFSHKEYERRFGY